MTEAEIDALVDGLPTKSAKMRELQKLGWDKARIARKLGVRYQFVHNVLGPSGSESAPHPPVTPIQSDFSSSTTDDLILTIPQAKRALARSLGVPLEAIEIIVKA